MGGPLEADFHWDVELVDLEILAVGLEAVGDDLKADGVADRNDIDGGFAVFVGLELHGPLVFVAFDGVEDDMGQRDRLAVVVAYDGDLDVGGRRRGLVFAEVLGVAVLRVNGNGAAEETERGQSNENGARRAAKHGNHCKWTRGRKDGLREQGARSEGTSRQGERALLGAGKVEVGSRVLRERDGEREKAASGESEWITLRYLQMGLDKRDRAPYR